MPPPEMVGAGSPSITDWISALSTAVIGVATIIFAVYQWIKTGFKPNVIVDLENSGERAIVKIVNESRGPGTITAVEIVKGSKDHALVPSTIQAKPDLAALPQTLLNPGEMMIVVRKAAQRSGEDASKDGKWQFPLGACVLVEANGREMTFPLQKNSRVFLDTTMTQLPRPKS
jgi:hypothetical protein